MSSTHIGMTSRALLCGTALGVALAVSFTAAGAQSGGRAVRIDATTARTATDWDRQIEGLKRAGALRLSSSKPDTLVPGRTHERFDQYYNGVRIFGSQTVRQSTEDGLPVSVFGTVHAELSLDTRPALNAEQAVARAVALTSGRHNAERRPELVILPMGEGQYALAWLLHVATPTNVWTIFVDAKTGAELKRLSAFQSQQPVGTGRGVLGDQKKLSTQPQAGAFYANDRLRPPSLVTLDLKGNLNRFFDLYFADMRFSQADVAVDADNQWTDGATVDAHTYIGQSYDYFFKRFGRNGFDNRNLPIINVVHPVRRSEIRQWDDEVIGQFYINAFFCGDCGEGTGTMVFGEGLPPEFYTPGYGGQNWNFLAGGFDVVAHEYTHGVTAYSSGLIYEGESGALNEAFSDIMGTSAEFFFQQPGNGELKADYLIGEDVVTPRSPGALSGLRSMNNPRALGQPDHYSIRYTGAEDNGGVHINSGIVNNVFYLAIEGGRNATSGRSVTGVGGGNREQIEKIFYRAFTQMLPPNANFSDARRATQQAAADLYGSTSPSFNAISTAWDAVGVQ